MTEPIYNSRDLRCKSPYGAAASGTPVKLTLRPLRQEGYSRALLTARFEARKDEILTIPMPWSGLDGDRDQFSCVLDTEGYVGLVWYTFTLERLDGKKSRQLGPYQLTVYDGGEEVPAWFGEGMTYQIFPDRFRRTRIPDPAGMVGGRWVHAAWQEEPEYRPDWNGEIRNRDFFGGDLRGVMEKLDYLRSLGVTTLYFCPVFEAAENHRYGTADYSRIDPMLGCEEHFSTLCEKAHSLGMRVMLDGVFNHTGFVSRYFNGDGFYPELGAHQSQDSPWSSWYNFQQWPDRYESWWGIYSLPAVNEHDPSYREFIFGGENSVVRRWLRAGADGWRLDVVHMLGEAGGARNNLQHVAGITEAAKETQPEAYIVGEHFGDARQWLQADVEDAAMNYRGFTFPLWGFLANTDISYDPQQIDAQTCMAWMDNYRAGLSHQQQLRMFNQLDSHDTARFKTLLGRDIARLPLAVVWLFTWPGVPCIYYGDEVGLDGKNDPFCRKPFPWQVEKQDTALFALYQRMIALRKKSQALRRGGCQVLYAEDNVVVFGRVLNQQRVLVAINRGEACEVVLPASPLLNVAQWQRKEGHGQLTDGILALPAISATVWIN